MSLDYIRTFQVRVSSWGELRMSGRQTLEAPSVRDEEIEMSDLLGEQKVL